MSMQMAPVSMMSPQQASLGTSTMTTGSLGIGPRMANGQSGTMQQMQGKFYKITTFSMLKYYLSILVYYYCEN